MNRPIPRIERAQAAGNGYRLSVRFAGDADDRTVDLSGWVNRLGEPLQAIRDPGVFATAAVTDFSDAVYWGGDEDGDLAIDALHLKMIADLQAPMTAGELAGWQDALGLSNSEAADLLGVDRSTFLAYKAKGNISRAIAIACRAALRDPVLVEALYQPSAPRGRPRS